MKTNLKPTDLKRDFIKTIEHMSSRHNRYDLFNDFTELAFCALRKPCMTGADADAMEERYARTEKKYRPDEVMKMADLLGLTMLGVEQGGCDFLGSIVGEMELFNKFAGQFFTPYHVSSMIAEMTLIDAKSQIEEQGYITIAEPACGAGGMILAASEVLEKQGVDLRSSVFVDATDIAPVCFRMTYLQLSLRGVPAIIRHANSLSLEQWELAGTPALGAFLSKHGEGVFDKLYRKEAA